MKPFLNILASVLLTLCGVIATSCADDSDAAPGNTPADSGADLEMAMILAVGDLAEPGLGSRAPSVPEGGYDRGQGYENYIDVAGRDFRIWFIDSENRYAAEFQVSGIVALESPQSSKYYHVLGRIERGGDFDPSRQAFKVMVLANWGTYPEPEAGTHIDEIVASAEAQFAFRTDIDNFPTATDLIPLYGIQEFDNPVKFNDYNFASLGNIHLLRSYAKIEVINSASSSYELLGVTLTRYNKSGMKAPAGVYRRADYVKNNWELDYTLTPTLPGDVEADTGLPLRKVADGRYLVYVPEYRNLGDGAERAELVLTFQDNPHTYTIEFRDYKSDDASPVRYDIMRNWWYRFTVTKSPDVVGPVDIEVDVQPYALCEVSPDFGLMRDERGDLMVIPSLDEKGNYTLPDNFKTYLSEFGHPLPEWTPDYELGDYYAIVSHDGSMANSEVWLKDRYGNRVTGNFEKAWGCSDGRERCMTRSIVYIHATTEVADSISRFHFRRRQHNDDHSTIVLSPDDELLYVSPDGRTTFHVESWEREKGDFWIEVRDIEADTIIGYEHHDKTGKKVE